MQLLAQFLIQRKISFQHGSTLFPKLAHLLFIAVIMLPQNLGRVAAQVQACGQAFDGGGFHRERQDAAIALFQLVSQLGDVVQQLSKTAAALWQPVQLNQ